ncbi:MAG: hypothetical protein A2297_01875 [Elusimicrobia bacterium RIFOXYB2_FULL_48_7]|nr:MAG: hypothetical protein A2297_01875 [Elusimicrobia bacterium RIFOXYB2_FULL_48_7]
MEEHKTEKETLTGSRFFDFCVGFFSVVVIAGISYVVLISNSLISIIWFSFLMILTIIVTIVNHGYIEMKKYVKTGVMAALALPFIVVLLLFGSCLIGPLLSPFLRR